MGDSNGSLNIVIQSSENLIFELEEIVINELGSRQTIDLGEITYFQLSDFAPSGAIEQIKSEVPYGKDKKSRIDFLLTPKSSNPDNRNIYVEVKNTTWIKENVALFPDTETKRGQKHLVELKELIPESKSVLIPCMTRKDADYFAPGDEADPLYGKLFRESLSAGMILIPCCFEFHLDHVSWNGIKSLKLD